jgi:hypothetical protein
LRLLGPLEGLPDGLLDDPLAQDLRDGVEDHVVQCVLADEQAIRADDRPALVVGHAAVEAATGAMVRPAREGHQRAAAGAALGDAAEQILLVGPVQRRPLEGAIGGADPRQASLDALPERVGDDRERRHLEAEPFALRACQLALAPPPIALAGAVPDDFAPVERPVQDLANGRRRPALAVTGRGGALGVQPLGDPREAGAVGIEGEDAPHDGGLGRVHSADDVLAPAVGVPHLGDHDAPI